MLATAHIAYDAYMPVMLAVMEIPGCLVALYLVAGCAARGWTPWATCRTSRATIPRPSPSSITSAEPGHHAETPHEAGVEAELEMALEKMEHPDLDGNGRNQAEEAEHHHAASCSTRSS